MSKRDIFDIELDEEERETLEAVEQALERGKLKSVDNLEEELAFAKKAATDYFRKDARINIRLSRRDLKRIKQLAAYEGMPYQTLIASLLHKYAAGYLKTA